jgi:hypothetical protein
MKITPTKILQFIEGNIKMLGDRFHLLAPHEKEQIAYRSQLCKDDCMKLGYCIKCGCSIPGKLYVARSCNNGERFPDLMPHTDWEKFKSDNDITL